MLLPPTYECKQYKSSKDLGTNLLKDFQMTTYYYLLVTWICQEATGLSQLSIQHLHTRKLIKIFYQWMLAQCGIKQLFTEPTHIHGKTLYLLCSSRLGHVMNTFVKCPGVSDHFIMAPCDCWCKYSNEVKLYSETSQRCGHWQFPSGHKTTNFQRLLMSMTCGLSSPQPLSEL